MWLFDTRATDDMGHANGPPKSRAAELGVVAEVVDNAIAPAEHYWAFKWSGWWFPAAVDGSDIAGDP
jgi:hypothetical protein